MKKVLFYGDSNTYGYDPRAYSFGRYPREERWTFLAARKTEGVWEIAEDGLNGRCIPDVRRDMGWLERLLAKYEPLDLFAVMLGTNDLFRGEAGEADAAVRRMEAFIQYLTGRSPRTERETQTGSEPRTQMEILLIAPVPMGIQGAEGMEGDLYREGLRMSEGYAELCRKYGLHFADAGKWGVELAYDRVHFSPAGCRTFAEKISELLLGELR